MAPAARAATPPPFLPGATASPLQMKRDAMHPFRPSSSVAHAVPNRPPSGPGVRVGAVLQRFGMSTRAGTLHELQVSSEIDPRLILADDDRRTRRSPAVFGIGDGTAYGVGAHANYEGVSTTNITRNFTPDEKDRVNKLGNMYGCNTCGNKESGWPDGHFTPDHQPPLSLAGPLHAYKGKLYPHCKSCSSKQGGILSSGY